MTHDHECNCLFSLIERMLIFNQEQRRELMSIKESVAELKAVSTGLTLKVDFIINFINELKKENSDNTLLENDIKESTTSINQNLEKLANAGEVGIPPEEPTS